MLLFFVLSEMLAWASAQIHCQFHASENRVALPPSDGSKPDVQAENETVFVPNRGECLSQVWKCQHNEQESHRL